MLDIAFWPLYLLIGCSALAGLGLWLLPLRRVWRWVRTRRDADPAKRVAPPGAVACGFELLGGLALLALAAAGVGLLGTIAGYRACVEKTLCAMVRAEPLPRQPGRIWLEYIPVDRGAAGRKQVFILNGDQWRVEGHVLRWSGWARMLGLRTIAGPRSAHSVNSPIIMMRGEMQDMIAKWETVTARRQSARLQPLAVGA